MRRCAVIVMMLGCIGAFGLAGCGSSSSSSAGGGGSGAAVSGASGGTTHFAKTKFAFHAGLAFGAFHRYIYKPFKSGAFGRPFSHKFALIKAGIASLFVYHELKLAAVDVKSSKILSALFAPITALANKLQALRSQFLGGKYSPSDISATESSVQSISSKSGASGSPISDFTPSASELASGVKQ